MINKTFAELIRDEDNAELAQQGNELGLNINPTSIPLQLGLSNAELQEEVGQLPSRTTQEVRNMIQAEPSRAPALGSNMEQSRAPASIESSSMTKNSSSISGTAPTEVDNSPEGKLERMMQELNAQRQKEMDDAASRKFKADIFKIIGDNVGGIVGGAQAMNTGASVTPTKTQGYDVGDLVGQVQKKFDGDREGLMNQYRMMLAQKDRAADQKYKQDMLEIERKKLNQKAAQDSKPTDFNVSQMKQLGKNSAEYYTKDRDQLIGNNSKISEGINLLQNAVDSKTNLSGGFSEYIPGSDFIRPLVNEEGEIVKNSIDSAITETLRPTLGAQFTEQEGERIKALQYNPKLPPSENLRRAKELQKFINKKLQVSDALYEHLGQGKPVNTFDFKKYGMQAQATGAVDDVLSSGPKTVERKTPDGKIAIFDAETKQFIRYKE